MTSSTTQQQKKLIKFAKQECKKYGVKFCRHKGKTIRGQEKSILGFFDWDRKIPELHFLTQKTDWEFTLIHELAHMYQWLEQPRVWVTYCNNPSISNNIKVEFDCERRAVEILEHLGFKCSKEYTKKANYHVITYLYFKEGNPWPLPLDRPTGNWKKFPDTFDINLLSTYHELKYVFD